jgi:hypothetical protein
LHLLILISKRILGKILYSEDYEEDFLETEEDEEDDKKNQNNY